MFLIRGWPFGNEERSCWAIIVRAVSFQDFQYVITIHQRHRRTDGRHAITLHCSALRGKNEGVVVISCYCSSISYTVYILQHTTYS